MPHRCTGRRGRGRTSNLLAVPGGFVPNTNSAVVRPSSTRRRGQSGKYTRGLGQRPANTSTAAAAAGRNAAGRNAVRAALEALEPRQMLSVSTSGGWANVAPGGGSKVVYV